MAYLNRVLKTLIRWAVTSKVVQESGVFPLQQVSYLGKVGDSVAWFPYGFHASPPAGALALLVASQGNAEARAHLPGSPKERPTDLAPTEVALYHPPTGTRIVLRANGDLEIEGVANLSATVAGTATVFATGQVSVGSAAKVVIPAPLIEAALGATLRLMDERMIAKYNAHTHTSSDVGPPPSGDQLSTGNHTTTILRGS